MAKDESQFATLGEVAVYFGLKVWQIRRLFERRLLPEPPRFGQNRMVKRSQFPAVEAALRKGGYLRDLVESK